MNARTISEIAESELLDRSQAGDREAFGQLVRRHQAHVCAVTYSICGNLAASQDVAQDAFLAAWRSLGDLRDRTLFKSWLSGIARNLALNARRAEQRRQDVLAQPVVTPPATGTAATTPDLAAARREEEDLVWRALESLPENARVPLVLFYREGQSVARVAEILDLTEDAVKQRLSRGRTQLKDQVLALVEGALAKSGPGTAFTLGVLAALPLVAAPSAAAATAATAAATQGTLAAKGLFGLGGLLFLLGPALGCLGGWCGYRAALKQAVSTAEAAFVRRFSRALAGWLAISSGVLVGLIVLWRNRFPTATFLAWSLGAWVMAYLVGTFILVGLGARHLMRLRLGSPTSNPVDQHRSGPSSAGWNYRSRVQFLGLPLLHVATGRVENGRPRRGVAVGWIAVGDLAWGPLIAIGGVAVGGVAIGGGALGILSFGGFSIGLLALGGFALGGAAVGGGAIGWLALGGAALGWKAALGGLAVAHEYAVGGLAVAAHANDPAARAWTTSQSFFGAGLAVLRHAQWITLLSLLPLVLHFRHRPNPDASK